jgi:DNA-directed RNA polymerase subunit beta'
MGMAYYRNVKIAGEDVLEEPVQEVPVMPMEGYDDEARSIYSGGLREDTGEGTLVE